MFNTLSVASTFPCGSNEYCDTLADTNSIAEAFLQVATHAAHPIHVAASNALSASFFSTGIALAS
jgi:hypothetical protein